VGLVIIGAALRLWQYAGNTSLWKDELSLALGIIQTPIGDLLLQPLPQHQVAPKGFVLLEKLAVAMLGPTDYALRLVPLLCSLVALVAFCRLASRVLKGIGPAIAVLLFAAAPPLIIFSALAKQYAVDVCVAVLLWLVAWELTAAPLTPRRARLAALAGAVLAWFSQTSVFLLAGMGALLLLWPSVWRSGRPGRRDVLVVVGAWAVSVIAVTLAGVVSMTPEARDYMFNFWSTGFPPTSLSRMVRRLWPWDQLEAFLGSRPGAQAGLAYPAPPVYALLTAAGTIVLWSRERARSVLLTVPVLVTLAAAIARQYPFSDRLILFLLPSFILAMAAAVDALFRLLRPHSRAWAWTACAAIVGPAVYPVIATPPVYLDEHVKPILALMQMERQEGDAIYVFYATEDVMSFYAGQYGLDRSDYVVSGCHRGDNRKYLTELDSFRGRPRVWVVITHSLLRYREREDILRYLDAIGTRRDGLYVESRAVGRTPLPAEGYLYDLSQPGRLASVSAETFRLVSSEALDSRADC
jgi:hypothetical protein